MKTEVKNISGCNRLISIEVSSGELNQKFDQVYADVSKVARVPGYRPGRVPRDLLETYYGKKAEEEVIKRAIPEYYLKAVREKSLAPVAPPEIENVQFKNHLLCFSARVDVKPKVSLKAYKNLRIVRKKIKIEPGQIDDTLERLRQSRAKDVTKEGKNEKERIKPELSDAFAKDLGFQTLQELKEAIDKDLQVRAEIGVKADIEKQLIEQLFKRTSLNVPESLVNSQMRELLNQLKLNRILQGEKKEDVESKTKELEDEARKEAVRRVKLSFILEEIAQREDIQVNEEDLDKRVETISQRSGKNRDEVRQYLDRQNLIPGLKAELRDKKTMEFLLSEAQIYETK